MSNEKVDNIMIPVLSEPADYAATQISRRKLLSGAGC